MWVETALLPPVNSKPFAVSACRDQKTATTLGKSAIFRCIGAELIEDERNRRNRIWSDMHIFDIELVEMIAGERFDD